MPGDSFAVDDAHLPIQVLTSAPRLTGDSILDLEVALERCFSHRTRFVLVCDLREVAAVPDALVRKRIAELMNRADIRDRQARFQVASVNIFASAPVRAAVTALLWLWSPPTPMAAVGSWEEAMTEALARARAAQIAIPPEVERWALGGPPSRTGLAR